MFSLIFFRRTQKIIYSVCLGPIFSVLRTDVSRGRRAQPKKMTFLSIILDILSFFVSKEN